MKESDAALIEAVLNGEKEAFGRLYDRYAPLVRAICYDTTRDSNQAQDLGQEVFLRAYKKLSSLVDPDRFSYWLVQMARNVCREYRRGKFRDRHILTGFGPEEEVASDREEPAELLAELQEAIGKLSEKERLALHVYYLQEQNVDQAQKVLGVSRSGLFRLLARAREKIQRYMKKSDSELK